MATTRQPRHFALPMAAFGLPTRDELQELRMWDLHYHGLYEIAPNDPIGEGHQELLFYIDRFAIERSIALDIGGRRRTPLTPYPAEKTQLKILTEQKDRISGIVCIDPSEPEKSVAQMEKWIANGPCVGIKYRGWGNRDSIHCNHPNNYPIVEAARRMNAIMYVHTWTKVGGEPRRIGGGVYGGENTPEHLVDLAKKFPDVPFVCGHGGGDWELGAQYVRPYKNIYFEFAGSDPHSGSVDYVVRELGVDRIVWGAHGNMRCYATEMSKVLDADLTKAQRMQIFGGNIRREWGRIFREKGVRV